MGYRYLRLAARFMLFALLALLLAVAMLLTFLLGTVTGREWAAQQGLQIARDAGVEISIDQLRSPGLGHWQVGHLALYQDGGRLLEITDLELRWNPRALLNQRLHIQQLAAHTLDYYQPPPQPGEAPPEDTPFEIPAIPTFWPVTVERFAISELGIHDLPLPDETELPLYSLTGSAQVFEGHYPVRLQLDIQSLPAGNTRLQVDTRALSRAEVHFHGSLNEPAGGLFGQLLRLPEDQPLNAQFDIGLEQDEDAYYVTLDRLKLPLYAHEFGAIGTVRLEPQQNTVQIPELILEIDGNRQRIRGAYTPADLWAEVILADLPLELAQLWVPELTAGSVSGRVDISWLHSRPDAWPKVDTDAKVALTYRDQPLSADVNARFEHPMIWIEQAQAQMGKMALRTKGAIDLEGTENNLAATFTHLDTRLLANWPEVPLPDALIVTADRLEMVLSGALTDPDISVQTHARGEYQQTPFDIQVDARATQRRAHIAQLVAQIDNARLNAQGVLDWTGSATALEAEFSRLEEQLLDLVPEGIEVPFPDELTFDASGTLRVSGALTAPEVHTEIQVTGTYALPDQTLPYELITHGSVQVGNPQELSLFLEKMSLTMLNKPVFEAEGSYAAELFDLRVYMRELPTQLFSALGWHGITGEAEADLHLHGSLEHPALDGFLEYRDRVLLASGRERVPVQLRTDLVTENDLLQVDVVFNQDFDRIGQLQLQLPLREYLQRQEGQPLPLRLDAVGEMDLGIVRLLVDPAIHNIDGRIAMDFSMGGHLEQPQFDGRLQLHEGSYTNALTGTRLRTINVTLLGDGTQVRIEEAVALGANGGSLTLSGGVQWAEAMRADPNAVQLKLVARNAELLQRRELQGQLQGEMAVRGSFTELWVTGDMAVTPLHASIEAAIRTTIPEIEVTEIGDESPPDGRLNAMPTVHLNLVIRAEQQAYLRGRGLDTELSGRIEVRGTLENPDITGRFVTRRGRMELFGNIFVLEDGEVRFTNDIISMRIPGVHTTPEREIRIEIFGTADAPEITLTSNPSMPEDEILAHLIFGRPIQEIGPFQAIRLASAVNTLRAGNGFDPVDTARHMLGVDTLTIDTDPDEEGAGVTVGVGKYLTERVYLELQRSPSPTHPWQASVQVELTPRIRLEGGTGKTGDGRAEILWKRDY